MLFGLGRRGVDPNSDPDASSWRDALTLILNPLEAPVKVRQSQYLERTWTHDSRAV